MEPYEFLAHTADLSILARGRSLEELFRNAMKALYEAMGPRWIETEPASRGINVNSTSDEDLLVDFYNELLGLADIEKEAYREIAFAHLGESKLEADLRGFRIDGYSRNIKAATHHDLSLKEMKGGFEATIVLDV